MFTMDQLMLHLLGDYVLQSEYMAANKAKKTWVAFFHALVYTIPFYLICQSYTALFVIFFTHGVIDRFRLGQVCYYGKKYCRGSSPLSKLFYQYRVSGNAASLECRLATRHRR